MRTPAKSNHYETLNLQPPRQGTTPPTQQDIRAAYRRALLANHPDKTETLLDSSFIRLEQSSRNCDKTSRNIKDPKWTVDEICLAYQVLSNGRLRREYDVYLQGVNRYEGHSSNEEVILEDHKKYGGVTTELDVIDLDDMEHNEATNQWAHACRCGKPNSFVIDEDDLIVEERPEDTGEILVSCSDCSHHVKVVFAIAGEASE